MKDLHASRYGVQGNGQHGIDVVAQDRRPEGTGKLWAFQAKHYLSASLQPQHLRDLIPLIEGFPHRSRLDTFVVVTTAKVTAGVKDTARELGEKLHLDFEVWDWEHFSELLRDHCGSGPWLSQRERLRMREQYCRRKLEAFQSAGPLYPLSIPALLQSGVLLKDVLLPRRLRLMPHLRAETVLEEPRASKGEKTEEPLLAQGGTSSVRYDGELVEWLSPDHPTLKPFVLVVAPMGGGKTTALFEAEARLAAVALAQPQAPLPWRLRAGDLVSESLEELVQHSREHASLWADPLSQWIFLIDEIEVGLHPQGLQRISELVDLGQVAGVAVGCRASHLQPRLLPRAQRIEVPPWSEDERREFLSRWRKAAPDREPASPVETLLALDPLMSANPLCNTLLALYAPKGEVPPGSRAELLRPLVDGLFRRWAEARGTQDWKQLQGAFERAALRGFKHGSGPLPRHVLEMELAQALGDSGVDRAMDVAENELGLIRFKTDGTWELPFRAVAEYLAAGALLDREDSEFISLAGQPWASEVARLALERCGLSQPKRVPMLLQRLLQRHPAEEGDHSLRRALVALQTARDLRLGPAAVESLTQHLMQLLTEERSTWRRRRVGEEVRSLALQGGPLWDALWRKLQPVLFTVASRAAWLARHEEESVSFWIAQLRDPDLAIRVVATEKLARWNHLPEVQEVLLGQLSDEGHHFGFSMEEEPVLAAASVLREMPHSDSMRERLRQLLHEGDWLTAGAAAVALLPGEVPAEEALPALQTLYQGGWSFLIVCQAIDAYRGVPEGKAWLEHHWPRPPSAAAREPSVSASREVDSSQPPPVSSVVKRELLWIIAPVLRSPELRRKLQSAGFDPRDIARAVCSIAAKVPEAAVELVRGESRFFPWEAQEALGQAASQHSRIGEALVKRWRSGADATMPSLFPGFALEPLAARGESDAVSIYAEWLPLCVDMVVPFPRSLLRALMAQPEVREAARVTAVGAWKYAIEGKPDSNGEISYLGVAPLGGLLRALWPAWTDEKVIREGLATWVRDGDLERMNAALEAWLQGDFPPEVAQVLADRLNRMDAWPREQPFFEEGALPLWLAAASRAGILRQIEPVLRAVAESVEPSPALYQACLYLMRLKPEETEPWARRAAFAWPFVWTDNRQLSHDDIKELVSAFPEVWARSCLDRLKEYGREIEHLFLQMADRLRNMLPPKSPLRSELVEALRSLASTSRAWRSLDFMGPFVLIDDEAQRLLFVMGELVSPQIEE